MALFSIGVGVSKDKAQVTSDVKWEKENFTFEIFACKFINFLGNVEPPLFFSTNAKRFSELILNLFQNYKSLH